MKEETSPTESVTHAPLHEILWSLGKSWLSGTTARSETINDPYRPSQAVDLTLNSKMRRLTVTQLATALRMQGIDEEHDSMLSTLEGLAMAGEIEFNDYIGRVTNLFPRTMDTLDVTLRMKIASLLIRD